MRGSFRAGWLVLRACLFGVALMGCAHWPFFGEPREAFQEATLPQLLDRIGARTSGLESLKALLTVEVKGSQSFLAGVTWANPGRLQVEVLSPFGSTLFELSVSDGMVRWNEPGGIPEVLGTVDSIRENPDTRRRGFPLSIEENI